MIEAHRHAVAADINDVDAAGAVDVGEPDPARVEALLVGEARGAVHRHLGTETAIAKIWPIAGLAIADPSDVGQAVTGHVGEKDRLRSVGEYDLRPALLVPRRARQLGRSETRLRRATGGR